MVSTRGRYALRVMLDLAEQESDRFIPLADIAKRQGISQKYLEIVIRELVKHKLLRGLRGKRGGYMLTAICAFLFDTIIGDPNSKWHPVVLMGKAICAKEKI